MIHHLSVGTSDLDRARAFYDPVMQELGLRRTLDVDDAVGYGAGITSFSLNRPADGGQATAGNGTHVAFEVETRSAVDAFSGSHWRRAAPATESRDCGRTMTRIITPLSSAIPTATR